MKQEWAKNNLLPMPNVKEPCFKCFTNIQCLLIFIERFQITSLNEALGESMSWVLGGVSPQKIAFNKQDY